MNQGLARTNGGEIEQDYFRAPGLSNSGMRDLAVSPLRYWARWIDPNRVPEEPTPEQKVGSALHCAVLEPDQFDKRYACELIPPEGCLITVADLRAFAAEHGIKLKGTVKAELIDQVRSANPDVPIFDVLQVEYAQLTAGKTVFKADDWTRIAGMRDALLDEPRVQEILSEGRAEVPMFATDPDTGVLLKGKLDWLRTGRILDLKSFSQKRGKSITETVRDALWYENYIRQAVLYATLCGWPKWKGDVVLAFVESEVPHEVRLISLRSTTCGQANVYWTRAIVEIRELTRQYARCLEHFGEKPWRYAQETDELIDEDIPQLAFAR